MVPVVFLWACLYLLSVPRTAEAASVHRLVRRDVIHAHRLENDGWEADFDRSGGQTWSSDGSRPLEFKCSAAHDVSSRNTVFFIDKESGQTCILVNEHEERSDRMTLPSVLKIDPSVVHFLSNGHQIKPKVSKVDSMRSPKKPDVYQLEISLTSASTDSRLIAEQLIAGFNDALSKGMIGEGVQSSALHWHRLRNDLSHHPSKDAHSSQLPVCDHIIVDRIHFHRSSFIIEGVESVSPLCLHDLVTYFAGSVHVLHLSISSTPRLLNFEARGRMQSGRVQVEPYTAQGLQGQGQVVGIADSGLDDRSCFFHDNSDLYPTTTTNRNGIVEPFRRKVIQYVSYADGVDELGGHGTHVSGSVAGHSLGDYGDSHGLAPQAKIAFYDIGLTERSFLKVPSIYSLFDTAYAAGARIHTNSWGNLGGLYGQMAQDADAFTYDHDEFVILFAAGNEGQGGLQTIGSPASAKNVITVGAAQLRTIYGDRPLSNAEYSVAEFSSMGPTYDQRIKPDIIAPGDYIQSAFAGSPSALADTFSSLWDGDTSCAVHQMSGTSMATPLTAGAVTLIRQYFMDPHFWARYCHPRYQRCQQGAFTPSGFLLKALVLQSGKPVHRYSDPVYDFDHPALLSRELQPPPDIFQGYGEIKLENILPLSTPDAHHNNANSDGEVGGLPRPLDLVVLDRQSVSSEQVVEFSVDMSRAERVLPLKITLCWYDPSHPVGYAERLLVHDLDLVVVDPMGRYYLGNKGDQAFTRSDLEQGKVSLDDRNPNEQVFIAQPSCPTSAETCVYRILVRSNKLYVADQQSFALVVTTAGVVEDVLRIVSAGEAAALLPAANGQTPPDSGDSTGASADNLQPVATWQTTATLAGGEHIQTQLNVNPCSVLAQVQVVINFTNPEHAPDAWPFNIELTIVDARGRGLAIGGVDTSMSKAAIITEWPDSWMSSANGRYEATLGVKDAHLIGSGLWTVYFLNSWSPSAAVTYDILVTLKLDTHVDSTGTCSSDAAPTTDAAPTVQPTSSSTDRGVADHDAYSKSHLRAEFNKEALQPKQDDDAIQVVTMQAAQSTSSTFERSSALQVLTVPFEDIELGAHQVTSISSDGEEVSVLQQDRVTIGTFTHSGALQRILLNIKAERADGSWTSGTDSWLLTVIITAPNGKVAVVGGIDYFPVEDRFYARRWPDSWIFRLSKGQDWVAERDLQAGELTGHGQSSSSLWTVELAMGNPYHPRNDTSFSGFVQCIFATPTSDLQSTGSVSTSDGALAGLLLLAAVVVTLAVLFYQKKRRMVGGHQYASIPDVPPSIQLSASIASARDEDI